MSGKKLTQKQENFCLKYSECGDASEAYRYTYNAKKMKAETINKRASELLNEKKNGHITGRVAELRAISQERSLWTVEKLIQEHTEMYQICKGVKEAPRVVLEQTGKGFSQAVEYDLRQVDASGAKGHLVEIGKLLGFYTEKLEVKGELSLKDFVKRHHESKNNS